MSTGPPPSAPPANYTQPFIPVATENQPLLATAPHHSHHHSHHESEERFPTNRTYRDLPFFLLFVLHLGAVGALLIIGFLKRATHSKGGNSDWIVGSDISNELLLKILEISGLCAAVAIVVAIVWLHIIKKLARVVIIATLIMTIVFMLALGLVFLLMGQLVLALIFFFFAAITALCFWSWRSRIAFATELLTAVAGLLEQYPGPTNVAYGSLAVYIVWGVVWLMATLAVQSLGALGHVAVVTVFLFVSFYWTVQVIKNVVHVTCSGVIASWYFQSGGVVTANPTVAALKRATTTSFGSICLGSLLVAVVQTLRALVQLAQTRRTSNGLVAFVLCLLACCLQCVDQLLLYFNMYAYTQVAVYGRTYCQAAKATWRLLQSHGVEAIINDDLIGGVLTLGCFIGAIATCLVGALTAYVVIHRYWVAMAVLAFFIGFTFLLLTMEVVQSGVVTLFVCFAEDPHALQRNNPHLYNRFKHAYGSRCSLLV